MTVNLSALDFVRRCIRFAPSPTGVFHVGNLRSAWVSWRLARALGEPWIVRYEDIDRPRVVVGAREQQRADMAALGLTADVELLQSDFFERHRQAFERAKGEGIVYACTCSRKDVEAALAGLASAPHGRVAQYSGSCRARPNAGSGRAPGATVAWRLRMADQTGASDFIVARSRDLAGREDFVPAYNWACAIDDYDGRYRFVVRAADLAPVLEQQRAIQRVLARWEGKVGADDRGLPGVFHCSLVTTDDGSRLEKRTKGITLAELRTAGIEPAALVTAFEKSFVMPALSGDASVLGEARERLRLSELISPDRSA